MSLKVSKQLGVKNGLLNWTRPIPWDPTFFSKCLLLTQFNPNNAHQDMKYLNLSSHRFSQNKLRVERAAQTINILACPLSPLKLTQIAPCVCVAWEYGSPSCRWEAITLRPVLVAFDLQVVVIQYSSDTVSNANATRLVRLPKGVEIKGSTEREKISEPSISLSLGQGEAKSDFYCC